MKTFIVAALGSLSILFPAPPNPLPESPPEIVIVPQESPLLLAAKSLDGIYGGECVAFIQRLYGSFYTDPSFRGWAHDIEPNATDPQIGDAVLESGKIGHAALIVDISSSTLKLLESNRKLNGIISYGRTISRTSPYIRGFYHFQTRAFNPSIFPVTHASESVPAVQK